MMTTYFGRGLNIAAVKIQKDGKLWVQSFFLFHPRREQQRAVVVYSPQRRRARKEEVIGTFSHWYIFTFSLCTLCPLWLKKIHHKEHDEHKDFHLRSNIWNADETDRLRRTRMKADFLSVIIRVAKHPRHPRSKNKKK